jgi:hypothetical protein
MLASASPFFAAAGATIATLIMTTSSFGWEFTPQPVCTLSHASKSGGVVVTYDPSLPQPYAIAVTGVAPWPDAPVFSMRFDGPSGLTIATNRQKLSDGGRTLTVIDTGFGNVLDGLEFNNTATALAGDVAVPFSLAGAAPEVQAFRACVVAPSA